MDRETNEDKIREYELGVKEITADMELQLSKMDREMNEKLEVLEETLEGIELAISEKFNDDSNSKASEEEEIDENTSAKRLSFPNPFLILI